MLVIREVIHADRLLLLPANLALQYMLLQSLVEVCHAHRGIDDRHNDQNDRDYRKTGERLPDRHVVCLVARLIHSGQLEDEISQSTKEAANCQDHPECVLSAGPVSGHKQDEDCDGDRRDGDPFLCIRKPSNNYKKLYCKA